MTNTKNTTECKHEFQKRLDTCDKCGFWRCPCGNSHPPLVSTGPKETDNWEKSVAISGSNEMMPGYTQSVLIPFIKSLLSHYKATLIKEVEGMIEEEKSALPQDDMEKTSEWYKIEGLKEVIAKIK